MQGVIRWHWQRRCKAHQRQSKKTAAYWLLFYGLWRNKANLLRHTVNVIDSLTVLLHG